MMLFAHYGGLDEIAVFAVPALLSILALKWAEKRTRRKHSLNQPGEEE
jgi:hypothetical protein